VHFGFFCKWFIKLLRFQDFVVRKNLGRLELNACASFWILLLRLQFSDQDFIELAKKVKKPFLTSECPSQDSTTVAPYLYYRELGPIPKPMRKRELTSGALTERCRKFQGGLRPTSRRFVFQCPALTVLEEVKLGVPDAQDAFRLILPNKRGAGIKGPLGR
jgi:hypothetical protein